jgi:hypothetical protein
MRYYATLVDRELEKGEDADQTVVDRALKAANEAARDCAPYVQTGRGTNALISIFTTPIRNGANSN